MPLLIGRTTTSWMAMEARRNTVDVAIHPIGHDNAVRRRRTASNADRTGSDTDRTLSNTDETASDAARTLSNTNRIIRTPNSADSDAARVGCDTERARSNTNRVGCDTEWARADTDGLPTAEVDRVCYLSTGIERESSTDRDLAIPAAQSYPRSRPLRRR